MRFLFFGKRVILRNGAVECFSPLMQKIIEDFVVLEETGSPHMGDPDAGTLNRLIEVFGEENIQDIIHEAERKADVVY